MSKPMYRPTDFTLEYGMPVYSVPFSKYPPLRFGMLFATGVHLTCDMMRA
jgi:hypothetical protein